MALDEDPLLSETDLLARHRTDLLNIIFDRAPMGIAVLDRDLVLRRCNPTWASFVERYLGVPNDWIAPGARFADLAPGTETTTLARYEMALTGQTVREEAVSVENAGITSYWDVFIAPLFERGEVVGLIDVSIDATERVLARNELEQRVAERTRELSAVLEVMQAASSSLKLPEVLRRVAKGMADAVGIPHCAIYLKDASSHLLQPTSGRAGPDSSTPGFSKSFYGHPLDPRRDAYVREVVEGKVPVPCYDAQTDPRTDKEVAALLGLKSLLAVPFVVKEQVVAVAMVTTFDHCHAFTERQIELAQGIASTAAVAIENARLYSQAEENAVAAERNRLARELHDAVTQTLYAASLIAEVMPRLWERDPDEGRRRVEELRQLTRGALAEMRTLLLELRPAALVEAGLGDLLRQLTEAFTGRARVPASLEVQGQRALPSDVQVALYRIAQEALNNIAKHAAATQVMIILGYRAAEVELRIADNGLGFDRAKVPSQHLGLGIMHERAEAIRARLQIDSQVGQGTQVSVIWRYDGAGGTPPGAKRQDD